MDSFRSGVFFYPQFTNGVYTTPEVHHTCMMNMELYAYMAGFVDADGSISVIAISKTKRFVPRITVSNCNFDVMTLFSENFGGKIRTRNWGNKPGKENWKTNYEWTLTSQKAAKTINCLFPFLRIKKKQGELAMEAAQLLSQSSSALKRWHPNEFQLIQIKLSDIKDKTILLNKRGK